MEYLGGLGKLAYPFPPAELFAYSEGLTQTHVQTHQFFLRSFRTFVT